MEKLAFGMGPVALGEPGGELRRTFAKLLADALGVKITVVATQSYGRLLRRAAKGELDLAWLPPALYIRLRGRIETARILLGSVRARPGHYRSALFVRPDSERAEPLHLVGSRVGWVDPSSSAGYLFPRFALLSRGLHPDKIFAEERFFRSHDGVVNAVRDGEVDVGATYAHLETDDDDSEVVRSGWTAMGESMRPILLSRTIPTDVVCAVKELGDETTEVVVKALAAMHELEGGPAVLEELLGVRRFEPVDPRDYDVVRAALNVAHLPIIGDE
jgi:phosphate/phosphite/phosphonate ABC transporter binding protein